MDSSIAIYKLARETSNRIDVLQERVSEGQDLQAAKEFCSYLRWSGIIRLIRSFEPVGQLTIDTAHIEWKFEQLESLTHGQSRQPSKVVSLQMSQLQAMNHKLDLIAGHVAKISPPAIETVDPGQPSGLRVIEGGVS